MDIRLDGKVALITGATGGIGSAIATEFYNSGATVVLNGRSPEKLHELSEKLLSTNNQQEPAPEHILPIAMDLSAIDTENQLVKRTIDKFGRLDIVVNNAAHVDKKFIIQTPHALLERINLINYEMPYLLTANALTYMKKQKFGRIINMTSISGQFGDRGMSAYAASKAALTAFTKSIAEEYGRYQITANCVAPGVIKTSMSDKMDPEYKKDVLKRIPANRFGNPEEVAKLITFLASNNAAYINGQEIAINGGLYR